MADGIIEQLGTIILAAGGLGIAAYGVVDGAKLLRRVALLGYAHIPEQLAPVLPAVHRAYGEGAERLLEAQYIGGRSAGELPATLRQGYRIGLPALDDAAVGRCAAAIGVVDADIVTRAAGKLRRGEACEDEEREALTRFEAAVDARIEAALALAENSYVAQAKLLAGFLAVAIAVLVGALIRAELGQWWLAKALLVGLVAVPVAPVAKDLANAVSEAARALRGR